MNAKEIRALLDLLREYGLSELELERAGERIRVRRETSVAGPPVAGMVTAASQPESPGTTDDRALSAVTVEAPMVGTFYGAPAPDAEPFVHEGDRIKRGQVLCIIEAMKLMNEIESKVAGRVLRALVENGQPVEYGQPLFLIEP
jgi:acetyl-CoA carboxylase biotin carboxyl carrier protein